MDIVYVAASVLFIFNIFITHKAYRTIINNEVRPNGNYIPERVSLRLERVMLREVIRACLLIILSLIILVIQLSITA